MTLIRSLQSLKNKFRTAVLSGLTAAGLLTGCTRTPVPDTQLVFDNQTIYTSLNINEVQSWKPRQELYLRNDANQAHYQDWLSQLDDVKGGLLLEKANAVNDLVNKDVTYLSDSANYHADEYFAPGIQTVLSGVGDCEDFAIAKLYALKYLDVPENRMALMFVATADSSKGVNHCVLAVDTTANNTWTDCLILDDTGNTKNSIENLYETGYTPFFIMNTRETHNCKLKILKQPTP